MIRDQFKDVKKVTSKESRKKISLGERMYYAKQISKLQDINKSLGVSMIITTVLLAIAYAVVLLAFILTFGKEDGYELWKFIVWTAVFLACLGFTIIFYVFIKPSNKKKIVAYRHELERISAQALSKAAGSYSLYGDKYKQEQVKKHAEDKERTLKQVEEKQQQNECKNDATTEENAPKDKEKTDKEQ